MSDRLDQLKQVRRRRKGVCRICWQRPIAAIVRIELKRPHPEGKGFGEHIDGRQLSICEDCALEVWPQLRSLLP